MKKKNRLLIWSLLALAMLCLSAGCVKQQAADQSTVQETPADPIREPPVNLIQYALELAAEEAEAAGKDDPVIREKIASMTDEEKAAQLFVITPEALTGHSPVTIAGDATREALTRYPVGGLVYLSANLQSRQQVQDMLAGVQKMSMDRIGLPLFLCLDEEGGTVARAASNPELGVTDVGNMSAIGASGDVNEAAQAGDTIGTYLAELGFNVDFAPVVDVLGDPDYELLKYRSFGSDPQLVSDMALALRRGLEKHGIQSVYKHFPGHGFASGDSHDGYVEVTKSLDELKSEDLMPYQAAIDDGLSWIMVGHISLPKVTDDGLPSSLSPEVVTSLLREEMGYDGLVITDGMDMGAIAENYDSGEAAVKALEAGCDMILMPADFSGAYEGVLEAIKSGRISSERLDQSLTRILRNKNSLTNTTDSR